MRVKAIGILLVVLALLPALAACGEDEGSDLDEVTIGLTFVPNIQFAPCGWRTMRWRASSS